MTKPNEERKQTKPYTPPKMVLLGHVRDLTLSGGGSFSDRISKAPKTM